MKYLKMVFLLLVLLAIGCSKKGELGSKSNPIKMYFVPSMEAGKIITSGKEVADYIHEKTGYYFDIAVPTSYAAVIEAMGTKETDIAWLATFAYVLAHEKYDAEVGLMTVRRGLKKYRGQFVARSDGKINSLEDINGKVIAYTDAASTSGYIYPSALLKEKNIKPGKTMFAGGHPQAILAVYQGTADVGCTYWSPPDENGVPQDARFAVLDTYPDVMEKIKIIGFTEWIPNDTVTFRKGFPEDMKEKIIVSLLEYAKTEKGKKVLNNLFNISDFVRADDSEYDIVRKTLATLGKDASSFLGE
ncbi:MAG: phosphonate ABC transporter substrate-binidng protein [Candidatus Cloacimonas sp. 4484_275]|nr:MAG: phosphonate ABC transporter substrate-binidng protein [Candidatus Cloacimonas sp. 4484_275]